MGAYEDTLAWLQGLEVTSGWDLKLERMRAALALRGHPESRLPVLHVAGTNGKGSTAAMFDAMLRAAGRRVGLYTSPHLVDFGERIRAGGRTIPRETVVELVRELRQALDGAALRLTHFEVTTLLALEWFARIGVEAAVIEVGLGGRLDATNVVHPAVTAITSIAHDHEEYLGTTLAEIAAEKAGVIKTGIPVVVGPVPPEAAAVIAARATAVGAPLVRVGLDATLSDAGAGRLEFRGPGAVQWPGLELALPGAFQRANAAVALAMLALVRERFGCTAEAVRRGLAGVRWPGRLAVVGEHPRVIVDGAHNPAGVEALVRELPRLVGGRPLTLVFAVMADKAWPAMLAHLLPLAARVVATRVGRRGLDPTALTAHLPSRVSAEVVESPRAAVLRGRALAAPDGVVLVAGSLFLAGEAYGAMGAGGEALFEPWHGWGEDGTEPAP